MAAARIRRRALGIEAEGGPQPTPEILDAAHDYRAGNLTKNKGTREENAAKKLLVKLIAKVKGLVKFSFDHEGKTIDVTYEPGKKETVDVVKLIEQVGMDEVAKVATVSMAAAVEAFGSNVANLCLETETGDHKLSVKERK